MQIVAILVQLAMYINVARHRVLLVKIIKAQTQLTVVLRLDQRFMMRKQIRCLHTRVQMRSVFLLVKCKMQQGSLQQIRKATSRFIKALEVWEVPVLTDHLWFVRDITGMIGVNGTKSPIQNTLKI